MAVGGLKFPKIPAFVINRGYSLTLGFYLCDRKLVTLPCVPDTKKIITGVKSPSLGFGTRKGGSQCGGRGFYCLAGHVRTARCRSLSSMQQSEGIAPLLPQLWPSSPWPRQGFVVPMPHKGAGGKVWGWGAQPLGHDYRSGWMTKSTRQREKAGKPPYIKAQCSTNLQSPDFFAISLSSRLVEASDFGQAPPGEVEVTSR